MIINEWQLGSKLSTAINQAQRSDFAFYLALLSPDVEESAQFATPEPELVSQVNDIYKQFAIKPHREYSLIKEDISVLYQHSLQLKHGGLSALRLASSLNAPPLSQFNDTKRIDEEVWQNCSAHSRRHIRGQFSEQQAANPAALYEVLQQLKPNEAA
ncbi:MAG TPA: VC2046/SO_2500 family protein [Rheinheimera sp.]|nr:VC2046/SO_2500 family protein [Rheinheimera sp.]